MLVQNKTNVLLPRWLLDQQPNITEQQFLTLVLNYLVHYPDYELVRVDNDLAVCSYIVEKKEKRRKNT